MFLQQIIQTSFQNEARAPKKTMPKTYYFLTSTFSCSCIDFGGSWASKLEPNWPSWAPRTFPKASKIQSFEYMCPRCFPRGSRVAPKGFQGLDSGATWAPSWSQVGHFGLSKWHIFAKIGQLEQQRGLKTLKSP